MNYLNDPKQEINKLYKIIDQCNYDYYILGQPSITDYEFDILIKRLNILEKKYPIYKKEISPTNNVFNEIKFLKIKKNMLHKHISPMLSLNSVYTKNDVLEYNNKIEKDFKYKYNYVCELKFDGVAISLIYINGIFNKAITRGNGIYGENITYNLNYMLDIPYKLSNFKKKNSIIEFRGEIFILKKKLDYINNYRKKNNMHPFNSGRNFIIGIVKLHNYNPIYNNILNYYIYDSYCYENDMIIDNHYMNLNIIKKYGLNVSNDIKLCNDINQINNYIDFYSNIKNKLDFYIDGIVIKINQYKIRSYLGVTSKYPKWAIAYKYNSEVVESTLNAIYYQVGRTGLITPIAKINPIKISGTIISSINLYNHVEISKLDLRVNDHVYIQKGGEIIPKIIGVNFQKRNQSIQFIHVNNCPSCNYILKRYNNLYYCNNSKNCTMQIINQIVHFISKDAMNIRDINFHTIKILYENKILKDYTDLFNIEKFKNKILNIKGFSNLFLDKLIYNINLSKNVNFKNFIFSLGINYVGIESAKKISYSYSNIHLLINAKLESLMKIPNIGEKTANSIVTFFHKKNNIEKIDKLMQFNIKIQYINNNQKRYILNGKIFVISGVFENYSRNKLNSIVIDNGGIITKNVSHKVSYIIGGKNMGPSKVLKAKKMKINIISIDFFLTMIKNDNIR